MRVCSFEERGRVAPGLYTGSGVIPLAEAYAAVGAGEAPPSVLALIEDLAVHRRTLAQLALGVEGDPMIARARPLASVRLRAPILYPPTIYCAGANYAEHVREMPTTSIDKLAAGADPYFFVIPTRNTVIGPDEPIVRPHGCRTLDYEIELAIVIGRTCKRVSAAEAVDCIAGFTIFVDITRRRTQRKDHVFSNDWIRAKSFDTSAPMGPCILLRGEGEPLRDFELALRVNGELRQKTSSSAMIVGIAEQIAWLARDITLHPGDVIATGSPPGTAAAFGERYLEPGDVVRAEIEEIGVLENIVVDPSA